MTVEKRGAKMGFHGGIPQVADPQLQKYIVAMAKRRADNRRKKNKGLLKAEPPKPFVSPPNPPDNRPLPSFLPRAIAEQYVDPAILERQRLLAERMQKAAAMRARAWRKK